ncbi:hypothetical protein I7I50_04962 [Histoplasma capsulatum G186AR]|uniref:Uncharacterized protein n=1 Tax=Ajellomyces capsulatus TaxID=5037 RepID=A0A8H7ZAI1_AJECA|nr:hypothetical protein I7I52_03220 [Histoplasma capsulatum]QSS75726.1 hypothetical protein I7I50_04962 [Histoplasma capsulatum G186AR]
MQQYVFSITPPSCLILGSLGLFRTSFSTSTEEWSLPPIRNFSLLCPRMGFFDISPLSRALLKLVTRIPRQRFQILLTTGPLYHRLVPFFPLLSFHFGCILLFHHLICEP